MKFNILELVKKKERRKNRNTLKETNYIKRKSLLKVKRIFIYIYTLNAIQINNNQYNKFVIQNLK